MPPEPNSLVVRTLTTCLDAGRLAKEKGWKGTGGWQELALNRNGQERFFGDLHQVIEMLNLPVRYACFEAGKGRGLAAEEARRMPPAAVSKGASGHAESVYWHGRASRPQLR